jgi:peptidoglycan/LPS O-acetylase OafA/YrhL
VIPKFHAQLGYRPDIDGLRAFAVLSVVVYHAFPSALPGGFVGVDVFFVISGFLISGIMFNALHAGTFSFTDFYARRIKRIFPALTLVLLVSFAFAWFVLFDDELKQLGNHTLRAVAFLSNFTFWRETGYFDSAAETKPLLHLWSLGVEEQFYIVWPLIIWALWRFKAWCWQIMAALTLASLTWNVYQSQHDLAHDFYSPFTRFWELSFGALLAYRQATLPSQNNLADGVWLRTAEVRSAVGAVLLVASVSWIDADKRFPGVWALFPVLGAVLLISGEGKTWVGHTLFGNRWVVWLGAISYPVYLWHWPIFSYARIVEGGTPSVVFRLAAVFGSIVLAWLTFKWVEKPIRFGWQFRYKTGVLISAMLGVGLLGYYANETRGFPSRAIMKNQTIFNVGDIGHEEFHDYHRTHFFTCSDPLIKKDAGEWKGMVRCFQSHETGPVTLVLLGDSHAEHLFLGVVEHLPNVNVGYYGKGALPFLSKDEFKLIFDRVLHDQNIRQVIITAAWASRLGEVNQDSTLAIELGRTIQSLQSAGKRVYVSDDVAKFSFDPQRCKFQRPMAQNVKCNESRDVLESQHAQYMASMQEVARLYPSVEWIEISNLMCASAECSMALDGQLLYRDNNHLNIPGSQFVGAQIVARHPGLAR